MRIVIHAASVNFADNLIAGYCQFKPSFPFSSGFEVSGVVAEVSADVESLKPAIG